MDFHRRVVFTCVYKIEAIHVRVARAFHTLRLFLVTQVKKIRDSGNHSNVIVAQYYSYYQGKFIQKDLTEKNVCLSAPSLFYIEKKTKWKKKNEPPMVKYASNGED